MVLEARAHEYPKQNIKVIGFPAKSDDFSKLFPVPEGMVEDSWPPHQLNYLGSYLSELGCKSIVIEEHYIDRDYIDDMALFYSRSLRNYPSYCYRMHFFADSFDQQKWRMLITEKNTEKRNANSTGLQKSYLGFSVVRPLAGAPLGRTVIKTYPLSKSPTEKRKFGGIREYDVYVAGLALKVQGLAFQQQDQGVSACATIALWSALHRIASLEGLAISTPADITEAASRYVLQGGRSLPSGGLSIHQICEATRSAGLEPMLIQGGSLAHDRAQILAYSESGFPPVLAIQSIDSKGMLSSDGHAVCAVGVKLGEIEPRNDIKLSYLDKATAVKGVYIHDDRLGPYAYAALDTFTMSKEQRTRLTIQWPGEKTEYEQAILRAIIVPVPPKIRLTVARMRGLAASVAQATAEFLPQFNGKVSINCVFKQGKNYQQKALDYHLSEDGLYTLLCGIALSRYIGVIEIETDEGPLLDVVLDATETQANPSVLACVRRSSWPAEKLPVLKHVVKTLGGMLIA